jgi:hypothetical protein
LNKEASAKHILIKGPEASKKLAVLKEELSKASDVSAAFSELAMKVGASFHFVVGRGFSIFDSGAGQPVSLREPWRQSGHIQTRNDGQRV